MPEMNMKVKPEAMTLSARIRKADGTIVELGEIAHYDRNPVKNVLWKVKKWLQR